MIRILKKPVRRTLLIAVISSNLRNIYFLSQALTVLVLVDDFINTFMGTVKAKRLRDERHTTLLERLSILGKVYNTCVETYPINSIIPCVADVYLDPVVQDLVMGLPLSATFTDENLATVGALFPDIVLRWRKQTEEKLLNMISQGCSTQNVPESAFQLATTIFSCTLCPDDPLTYPRVLVHRCATKKNYNYHPVVDGDDLSVLWRSLDCSYWNAGNYMNFEAQKIAILTKVIKLCGLDPKSATREDMDKQNPIFECLACNDARKGRCTLSWLGVVCFLILDGLEGSLLTCGHSVCSPTTAPARKVERFENKTSCR